MRKVCIHIPLVNRSKHNVELPLQFNRSQRVRLLSYSIQFVNDLTTKPAPNNFFTSVNVGLPFLEPHVKTTQKIDSTATGSEARLRLPVNLGEISTIEHPNLVFDLGGSQTIKQNFDVDIAVDPFLIHRRYDKHHDGTTDDIFEGTYNSGLNNLASSFQKVYTDYNVKTDRRVYPSLKMWLVVNEALPLLNPLTTMFDSIHNKLQMLAQSHRQMREIQKSHHMTQIETHNMLNKLLYQ